MELREALIIGRRWWLLLLLGPLLAGGIAFALSRLQPAEYQAEALLLVNSVGEPGTLGADAARGGQDLARTYQALVGTWPVLEPVIAELGLDTDVEELQRRVDAEALGGTQVLRIVATDATPEGAAALANALATSFASYAGEQQTAPFRDREAALSRQLADVEQQLTANEALLAEAQAAGDTTALLGLQASRADLQGARAQILDRLEAISLSIASTENHVAIAAAAQPPTMPAAPRPLLMLLIGAVAGLLVVLAAVAVIEYANGGRTRTRPAAPTPSLESAPPLPRAGDAP